MNTMISTRNLVLASACLANSRGHPSQRLLTEVEGDNTTCVWTNRNRDGSCMNDINVGFSKWTSVEAGVICMVPAALLVLGAYYYVMCRKAKGTYNKEELKSTDFVGKEADDDDSTSSEVSVSTTTSTSTSASTSKSTPTSNTAAITSCPIRQKARSEGLVLYDGNWYSVSNFVPYHPGGAEVLNQYLGTDISFVFRVMHRKPDEIMKRRKPIRPATPDERRALSKRREEVCHDMMTDYRVNYKAKMPPYSIQICEDNQSFNLEKFEQDVLELHQSFVKEGLFRPSRLWLFQKTSLIVFFLSLSVLGMKYLPGNESPDDTTPFSYILPGIALGLFWHQSGYMMHDAEHHNLAGNELVNDVLGWMYGTVFLGVNGAWWREEHREHHAMLNTYDAETGCKDPQMREDVWIQNKKLIPFYGEELIHFLCNFQQIMFLPIMFIAGRVGIVIDSTVTERKFRPWTIFGNILHALLHYAILSQTSYPLQVYTVASFQQAILSLQLLGNHYALPWNTVEAATEGNYFLWQVLSTQDFACYKWARWYYGGLNFHYSHHLFPTLPRESFHITTPRIQKLCETHGLPFIEIEFVDCVKGMLSNFNDVKNEFAKHGSGTLSLVYT